MKLHRPLTLSIDIGGTGIKMMIVDAKDKPQTTYFRMLTPHPATHSAVLALLKKMIAKEKLSFDRISAGFPGVVINGVVKTAPNLHPTWRNKNFQKDLEKMTGKPARVANDADVQGYGDSSGKGLEMMITLGTGVGSALFMNAQLVPNLELGHHPFLNNLSYEELLGEAAFKKHGVRRWNKLLKQAIALWAKTFNYQKLYLGGGYAQCISFRLPANVKITSNVEGVLGGIKLWENHA